MNRPPAPPPAFDRYLARWNLTPDGKPIATHSSVLLPVRRHDGVPAMLKIAHEADEKFGWVLMRWWDGDGAARVFEHDGEALLVERAEGTASLAEFARNGRDDEATAIICSVVERLHAPRSKPPPEQLVPLTIWFRELEPAATAHGGILMPALETANKLLASPQDVHVLHGDIHHDNILDFGPRGWLAIDPKRLIGERGFDYANVFCNPDYEAATAPHRFAQRFDIIRKASGLEPRRLLQWILAWAGLSAAWFIGDGVTPETDFAIAELALAELNR
jgi:streptomycin 6-kinase